jgi:hypothetical protein
MNSRHETTLADLVGGDRPPLLLHAASYDAVYVMASQDETTDNTPLWYGPCVCVSCWLENIKLSSILHTEPSAAVHSTSTTLETGTKGRCTSRRRHGR